MKDFDQEDFDNWLADVNYVLARELIDVDEGEGHARARDLYLNDFSDEDAVKELLRPAVYSDVLKARAASVLLAALIDIARKTEIGTQARAAIAQAKEAGIEVIQ